MEGILWLLSKMLFSVRNVEILLNPFRYMISKPVPVAPARLMVGMSILEVVLFFNTLEPVQNRLNLVKIIQSEIIYKNPGKHMFSGILCSN